MDHARPDGERPAEPSTPATSPDQPVPEALHALFYRRVAGDDALLQLANLRFAQTGLAAETYADSPGELEHVLEFIPPHPRLPTVHLNRGINLLNEQSRATVGEFADRFAGRIGGLVVHDHRDMGNQTDRLLTVLRELNARLCELPDGPLVFLEYAAGLEPGWFVELAEKLQDAERVSVCIDIGHLGIWHASARFARSHPGLNLRDLHPGDARLPELAADVQDAVGSAVGDVIDVAIAFDLSGEGTVSDYKKLLQDIIWNERGHPRDLAEFLLANGLLTRVDLDLARKTATANERSGKTEMTRRRLQYLKRK